jgi:hypothetical protein
MAAPTFGGQAAGVAVACATPAFSRQAAVVACDFRGRIVAVGYAKQIPYDPFTGSVPVWDYSAAGLIATAAKAALARGDQAEYVRLSNLYWQTVEVGLQRDARLKRRR